MLAWVMNLGFAASGGTIPPPPPVVPPKGGGGGRRRGSVWEPSVALAIAAAEEERQRIRAARKGYSPPTREEEIFAPLEVVQIAIKHAKSGWLQKALKRIEEEEQHKIAAFAREQAAIEATLRANEEREAKRKAALMQEELEAAQAIFLIMGNSTRH